MTLSKCSKFFNTETQGYVWLVTQIGIEPKDMSILLYTNGNGTQGLTIHKWEWDPRTYYTQMGMGPKDLLYTNGNGTQGLVCLIIQMGMGPKDSFGSLYTTYIHLVVNVCLV